MLLMKKAGIFILFVFIASMSLQAQKLTIESMQATNDLSASQYRRADLNGEPCGLVKVSLAARGATFEGSVIEPVEYKTGEYWVYMSKGSRELRIKHPSYVPLHVKFADYGIKDIQPLTTYNLILVMPQTEGPVQTQKLIINYSPANAIVMIDSKLYRGNGRAEAVLPIGSHNYVVAVEGYETAEGSVKLTATAPRTVTEHLVALAQQPAVQQAVPPVAQPTVVQKPAVSATPVPSQSLPTTASNAAVEPITVNGVSFNMVRVDGGTFTMGATSEQDSDAESDEKPAHQVTLSSYCIGETEVTQELWHAVMDHNPSNFKGNNLPVEQVSWEDCQAFIQKLNQLTERRFRLPTEAEWEYAARGGSKSRGYKYSGSNNIDDVAWYTETTNDEGTHDVKTKQANELGLYDMSGNVLEWCWDKFGRYNSVEHSNPTGPADGKNRVLRGGCWNDNSRYCRVSNRNDNSPSFRFNFFGLRLAL